MQVKAQFDLSNIIPQHTKFVLVMLPKGVINYVIDVIRIAAATENQ